MNKLTISKALILVLGLTVPAFCEPNKPKNDLEAVDGPNVRVMKHEDGSRTMFRRTPDNRTLYKKKYSANGVLTMLTVYRMDANENPRACKIFDGQGNLMFKVSYGYRKSDGLLVEERMFDAKIKRRDPNTGKEMPVQVIKYVYDANGERSAPIIFNLPPGDLAENVFSGKPTYPEANPFKDGASGGR